MTSLTRPFNSRTALRLGQALHLSLLIGTCLGTSIGISYAGPEGGVVSGGSATISQAGNSTTINQSSNRALIDWDSFNVDQHESVNFIQNGASSIAVNRIHDANPSTILGSLTANGQIILINPNGVVFGGGSQVDVGSLVVSTASPTEQDAQNFISGQTNQLNLSVPGNPNAKIINTGNITARDAGLVGFVAPGVINNGVIIANGGTVQLASGDMATVDLYGDGLFDVAVSENVRNQLIEQNGWVQADGGKVVISAAAGEQIINSVINMGGVTQAHSIDQKDGKIILKGDSSTINVTGKIDASGKATGQKGGTITATAKHINLKAGSTLDASGDKGGGTIKVGGDYKGLGDLSHALTLTMEQGSTIYNDAISQGNGGTTILWSDDHTYFAGNIFGRGGAQSGNGGFVETSGKQDLTARGSIDLLAVNGDAGTWLLDPADITIYNRSQGGTDNVNTVTTAYLEGQGASIVLTADHSVLFDLTGDILTLGANRSFTVTTTTGSITAASAGSVVVSGTGAINLTAGSSVSFIHDLDLTAQGSGAITLRANNNISYNGSGDITTNGGAIVLNSDRDATGGGNINFFGDTQLISNGGNITLGGGADPAIGYAIGNSNGAQSGINLADAGTGTVSPTINAGGGNIIINGQGWEDATASGARGVAIKGAQIITTGNGTITINGKGGGTSATTSNNNHGVLIYASTDGVAPLVQTQNGMLSITGESLEAAATPSSALTFSAGSTIQTTGTGDIVLKANNSASAVGNLNANSTANIISGRNLTYIGDKTNTLPMVMSAVGDIIIRPNTASTTVLVGDTGTGTLQINNTSLGRLTYGGTLWLGGYGLTGAETGYWNSAGNLTLNTTRSFSKNVNFLSGGNILSGGASTITLTSAANTTLWALGDILMSHDLDITSSGTGSVTQRAGGSISYLSSGDITTAGGNIILNADRDATNGGAISLGSGTLITSNGGNITLGGGADPATTAAIGVDTTYTQGIRLSGATVDASGTASGGNIIMNGTGWSGSTVSDSASSAHGIFLNTSTVKTNFSGSVTATGTGGGTGAAGGVMGIFLRSAGNIEAVNGAITLTGTSGTGNMGGNYGIGLSSVGLNKIQSLGSGAISLTGTGVGNGGNNNAIYMNSSTGGILSTSGIIGLNGTSDDAATIVLTSGTIGGAAATGAITLTSNKNISLAGALSTIGSGNITINAGNNLVTGGASSITTLNGLVSLNAVADIIISHDYDITVSGTGSVTERAGGNIVYSVSGDITTAGGTITLNADRDATNGGAISLGTGTEIKSNGGNITLGGGTNPETTMAIGTSAYPQGIRLTGATIDARGTSSGGHISMRGQGWADGALTGPSGSAIGVLIAGGSSVQTNFNGTLTVEGKATSSGGNYNIGVFLYNGSTLSAVNGAINIHGTGNYDSAGFGVAFSSSGANKVESTGSGAITITGTATTGTGTGILINSGSGGIFSNSGNITLTALKNGIGTLSTGTTGTIGGTNATGLITMIADAFSAEFLPTVRTTGDIVIRPYTNGTTVGIGAGTGALGISDAFMNGLTWGNTLWLGGYGLTGAETGYWNAAGNLTLNTTRSFAQNVNFLSGGNILSGANSTITLTSAANTTLWALGDILISHDLDITSSGTGSVTERAGGSIYYSAGGDITTNGGHIVLNSDRDGTNDGWIRLRSGVALASNGGNITLGGGTNPETMYAIANSTFSVAGVELSDASVEAKGGNVIINGRGWGDASCYNNCFATRLVNSTISATGNGTISINSIGGGDDTTTYNSANRFINSSLSTVNGNITLTGSVFDANATAAQFSFNGVSITTTGTGNVTFISTNTNDRGRGFSPYTVASSVVSAGHITYIGNSLSGASSLMTFSAAGDIIVRPYTNGTTVGVGSGVGTLGITDAFLDTLTWGGTLWLGGYGLTGAETGYWNSAGNMALRTRNFAGNVNFLSGGNIVSGADSAITLGSGANATLWALGNILISHDLDITASGTGSVTQRAGGNIVYSGGGDITTAGGAIVLNADRDATNGGAIVLGTGTEIKSNGGHITLGGGAAPATTAAIGVSGNAQGISLTGATVDARGTSSGGNIIMNGQGYALSTSNTALTSGTGVFFNGSTVQTDHNGTITLKGTGGGTGISGINVGVFVYNTSSVIAVDGLISITGQGGTGTSNNNPGFSTSATGTNKIQSTGSGHIVINGTGGTGTLDNYGIVLNNASATGGILSTAGNITLTAMGTGSAGWIATTGVSNGTIGGANATGTLSFIANGMSYGGLPTLQTTGSVIIRPYTAGTTVDIGTTATGALQITDAFLDKITYGGTLWLGGYGLTGLETGYWNSSGEVTLSTTRTFAKNLNIISGAGIASSGTGTITLSGTASTILAATSYINMTHDLDITASGSGSVTLRTGSNLVYSGAGDITTNGGTITLNSDRDATNGGAISLAGGTSLVSNGGTIILGGGADPTTGNAQGLSGRNMGISLTNVTIDATGSAATGGNIILRGAGWSGSTVNNNLTSAHGILLNGSTVSTNNSGTITLNGTGGGTGVSSGNNMGVYIYNGSTVSGVNGVISITGVGGSGGGNYSHGAVVSVTGNNRIISTGSGAINVNGTATVNSGFDVGVLISSATGGIFSNSGAITLTGSSVGNQSSIEVNSETTTIGGASATGDISLTGTRNIQWGGNLSTAGSGTVTFNAGDTIITSASNNIKSVNGTITLTGTNGISLSHATNITSTGGNVVLNSALASTVAQTFQAGGTLTANAISMGANNLTLTANDLVLNGNLSGTGTLTLQPYATNRVVNVNYGTADGSNFNLSTAELGRLVNNWSSIVIGRLDSTVDLGIGASSWTDPVTFRNNYRMILAGALTATGDASVTFTGGANSYLNQGASITTAGRDVTMNLKNLNANGGSNITTNGGHIAINNRIYITSASGGFTFSTSGGDITIGSHIGDYLVTPTGQSLVFNAGSGTVSFGGSVNTTANISATAGAMSFNAIWGSMTPLGSVSLTSTNSISLPSITASSVFVRTTDAAADITIGSGSDLSTSGSGGITLAAGRNFINQSGSNALQVSGGGRWLVYSTDVTGTTGEEDLANNFNRYSCSYSGGCATGVSIPGTGNGLIYAYTPILTITPTITGITYGDAVPGLNGYSYNVTGYLGSDLSADALSGTLVGSTDYTMGSDIGSYALNHSSGSLLSSLGYGFTYANKANGVNVTPRVLTATLTGTVTKVYDGNTNAALTSGNYILSNVYNNEDVSLGNLTAGQYGDKNAGTGKNVTVNGLILGGTKAGNYVLASNNVSGTVGTVTPKGLTVTATAGQNKTYGSGADGVLGYSYTGLIGGETSTSFSGALGRAAGENAGLYAINQGSLSATGNYTISNFVTNNYTINKASITITAPNGTRYYGDANPVFNWSDATINGLVNGETGSVLDTLTFNVAGSATSNAGTTHAITLGTFSDNNYVLNGFTNGVLTVNKASLTIYADSKIRPMAMPMPALTASYAGLRNGETESVVSGLVLHTTANASSPEGSYTITASGASAANYNISYVAGNLLVLPGSGALPPTVVNPAGITQANPMPVTPTDSNILTPSKTGKSDSKAQVALVLWNEPDSSYSFDNALVTFTPELREILGLVN